MNKKVVIVGGVAGGANLAARLRRLSEEVEIVVIERGEFISYANCGLPYYASGLIKDRDDVLVISPVQMSEDYAVDLRLHQEVVGIDRDAKKVQVYPADGEPYDENYDILVLSPGAMPNRPSIEGVDSKRVTTLWTLPDAEQVRQARDKGLKETVILGGGPLGLELAETLTTEGVKVHVVEQKPQVMSTLDHEMSAIVEKRLRESGVILHLGQSVTAFEETSDEIIVHTEKDDWIETGIAVICVGVHPNVGLAKEADLEIGEHGGIVVDDALRTSDPSIFAIGDAIEVEDFVFGEKTLYQLAGPVVRQARIVADELVGTEARFSGTQGTVISKVFDLAVASTGHNEAALQKRGMVKGVDYHTALVAPRSHASYYPDAQKVVLKLLFSADGKTLYGAQSVGADGADKRMDIIATALRLGASVLDLQQLELAYSPPYATSKDPVNMLGFVAQNIVDGLVRFCEWDTPDQTSPDQPLLLDSRGEQARKDQPFPNSIHIPMNEVRERLDELPKDRRIISICQTGRGAYKMARILTLHGFDNVWTYPGGASLYFATHDG